MAVQLGRIVAQLCYLYKIDHPRKVMKEWTIRLALMMWRYGWESCEMEALMLVQVVSKALAGKPPKPQPLIVSTASLSTSEKPDRAAIRAHAERMAGRGSRQGIIETRR